MYATHMQIQDQATHHERRLQGDDLFGRAAEVLFQLGRSFARLPSLPVDRDGPGVRQSLVQVCLAIVDGQAVGNDVTVGSVASALGIEPSTASRLVAQAVAASLVRSAPAAVDRRRLVLDLTGAGVQFAHDARSHQRRVFEELTATWDPADRETFARLFIPFAAAVIARTAAERAGDPP